MLAEAAKRYEGEVQFLGVDIQDQRPAAVDFIERFGWIYPSVFDPSAGIRDGLGLIGQPHTLVFDARGERVFAWSGEIGERKLHEEIGKVL